MSKLIVFGVHPNDRKALTYNILQTAKGVRRSIRKKYGDVFGFCGTASDTISKRLRNLGIPAFTWEGTLFGHPDYHHCWVLIGGLYILDVTADQFNGEGNHMFRALVFSHRSRPQYRDCYYRDARKSVYLDRECYLIE